MLVESLLAENCNEGREWLDEHWVELAERSVAKPSRKEAWEMTNIFQWLNRIWAVETCWRATTYNANIIVRSSVVMRIFTISYSILFMGKDRTKSTHDSLSAMSSACNHPDDRRRVEWSGNYTWRTWCPVITVAKFRINSSPLRVDRVTYRCRV